MKRLSAIETITRILVTDGELDVTLLHALDHLINGVRAADAGIVWRYDPSAGRLVVQTVAGVRIDALDQLPVEFSRELAGRVFQTGKIELYPPDEDMFSTEGASPEVSGAKHQNSDYPASAACLSLNTDKAKYGVLTFLNLRTGARFGRSDISFFQIVADLLSLSIERMALIEELEAKDVKGNDDRYKAALIPTLCHEMRTPLTSIKGYSTALLMEDAVFAPETQREFLRIIDRECDILEGLISDYLESSTIDAGMMKIDLEPVRLTRMAARAAEEVGHRFPKHSLIVDFSPEFPLIDADPERILQVLRQLLDNAAKYSPKGGLIVLQGRVAEDRVVVSVADEGVGIDPEDLNHLFERFFRAKRNSGTQAKIIGTGLGLPISRAIIEAHGGRIWAESEPGRGSKFYFSLPMKNEPKSG